MSTQTLNYLHLLIDSMDFDDTLPITFVLSLILAISDNGEIKCDSCWDLLATLITGVLCGCNEALLG